MDTPTVLVAPSIDEAVVSAENHPGVEITRYDGSSPEPHDVVLIPDDDDELLSRARDWFTDQVGVVVLDRGGESNELLLDTVGVGLPDSPRAAFVHRETDDHARVIESRETGPLHRPVNADEQGADQSDDGLTSSADREPAALDSLVRDALSHVVTHDQQGHVTAPEGTDFPKDLEHYTFTVTKKSKQPLGYDGDRIQEPEASVDYHFTLFLNDPPHGEHYQYVHLRQEMRSSPGNLKWTFSDTWSYGAMQINLTFENEIADSNVVLEDTSPENEVEKTTVTDTTSFDVGFSTADGASSSFGYSQSKTHTIKDWEVIERSKGDKSGWTYAQYRPFDGRYGGDSSFCTVCNGRDLGGGVDVDSIPNLSNGTLQLDTQSVWRTEQVTSDTVTLSTSFTWYFSLVTNTFYGCEPHWWDVPFAFSLDIDLGKVPEKTQ